MHVFFLLLLLSFIKVCRASLQFLRLMVKKPVLDIESLNPTLFAFLPDLRDIKVSKQSVILYEFL